MFTCDIAGYHSDVWKIQGFWDLMSLGQLKGSHLLCESKSR